MVEIELGQQHVHGILVDLAHLYLGGTLVYDRLQFLLEPIEGHLRVGLIGHPAFLMHKSGVERDVAEKVEEVIIVQRPIGSHLRHDVGIGRNGLVGQYLVAGIHAGIVVIPVHVEESHL